MGAAETLLLFAAREVRRAPEEVVDMPGPYAGGSEALARTGKTRTGKPLAC